MASALNRADDAAADAFRLIAERWQPSRLKISESSQNEGRLKAIADRRTAIQCSPLHQ